MLNEFDTSFVKDFERADRSQRFILGVSDYAASLLSEYDVAGVIDDFTENLDFLNVPIFRSSEVPKSALVVSASMLRPHSAQILLDSLGLRNLDYYAFSKASSKDFKQICFWNEFKLDYKQNLHRYLAIRERLSDVESIFIWDSIINFRLTSDISHTKTFKFDPVNQYFEPFLEFSDANGVFYDVGCFDGDTSEQFASRFSNYKAIYGFEPDPVNALKARKRFDGDQRFNLINFGLSDKKETVTFASNLGSSSHRSEFGDLSIDLVSLDSLSLEPPTFIKMDIEGGEISALLGARQTIENNLPTMAISVYHKFDDFYLIPELILSMTTSYKLFLRHYTQGIDETVMFFIPTEKAS